MKESVILDTQRLGVLTGQYVQAIRLCSTVRRFKEAVQTVTTCAKDHDSSNEERLWDEGTEKEKDMGQIPETVAGGAGDGNG